MPDSDFERIVGEQEGGATPHTKGQMRRDIVALFVTQGVHRI
jgi:hypothetical protein